MKTFTVLVFANYLLRLLLAAYLSAPYAGVVTAVGIGNFPAGDRVLFAPSGLHLLELLRVAGPELAVLGQSSLKLLVAVSALLLLGRALTFSTMTQPRFELGVVLAQALRLVPGYLLIAGLVLLAQLVTLGLCLWLGLRLSQLFGPSSERGADLTLAGLSLLGLLLSLSLGGVGELARASMAHERQSGFSALARGLWLCRRAPLRLLSRWAGLGAAGIALVLLATKLVESFAVWRAGAWRVTSVFGLHQLVVLALVALHVTWLWCALRAAQEPAASR